LQPYLSASSLLPKSTECTESTRKDIAKFVTDIGGDGTCFANNETINSNPVIVESLRAAILSYSIVEKRLSVYIKLRRKARKSLLAKDIATYTKYRDAFVLSLLKCVC
jgi:hypothetical protein